MEIIILSTAQEVGTYSAEIMADAVRHNPQAVWGVATGSSPIKTYEHLAELVRDGLDVSAVKAFALDEYVEIPEGHPESYRAVINREIVEKIGLQAQNVHVLNGQAQDVQVECAAYEQRIKDAGGVDVQLLGIGANGHIGFNEPGSSLVSRTRIKTLAPRTREDNARFFDDDIKQVPIHCLTQGIGTIMESQKIVLVAQGKSKARAIAQMVEGPIGTYCPASILQMHPEVTIVIDEDAASELTYTEYYRYAQQEKPEWQKPRYDQ
ncbi:glucosamine-6-phosphate deaminase [Rothia sp. P13129]|uniref:glucosamine-6-phosphate deaminase n=1 Tax=Rothia sp. P13129 TaxID=3402664 RepID=UPI003ACFEC92